MGFFETFLNPVFDPLLGMNSLIAVIILSLIMSLLVTVIYKFTTNQKLMKDLKDEMNAFQKEMKELRNDPKKAMAVQQKAMQTNMKYMSHSMRSTLFTMLPILLIFGWMNANLAFTSIHPDTEFTTTMKFYDNQAGNVTIAPTEGITIIGNATKQIANNQVSYTLKGKEGDYLLEYDMGNIKYFKELIITKGKKYAQQVKIVNDNVVKTIELNNQKLIVMNLFGWKLGWLGTYILLSILFSSLLRKFMKVY